MKSRQAHIDGIVYQAIATGIRTRDALIREVRGDFEFQGLYGLTDKALKEAVSRTTSRADKTGKRDIWCVPKAYRYVSISRVWELVEASDQGALPADEVVELGQSRDDLYTVAMDLEDRARKMFAEAYRVRDIAINAHCSVLDLGGRA